MTDQRQLCVAHCHDYFFFTLSTSKILHAMMTVCLFLLIQFVLFIYCYCDFFAGNLNLVFVSGKVNETEVFVDGHDFRFFSKPYYLRLLAV